MKTERSLVIIKDSPELGFADQPFLNNKFLPEIKEGDPNGKDWVRGEQLKAASQFVSVHHFEIRSGGNSLSL